MRQKPIVLLDLDDTILDFHAAERAAITASFTSLGIAVTEQLLQRYSEHNADCWEALERGEMTRSECLVTRFARLFAEYGIAQDPREAQDRYEERLKHGHYFVPGAEELLETLYGKYDLYIVSNGNTAVQAGRLKSADISHYFGDIFVSETLGVNKPSREFFDVCFSRIPDFSREMAVMVGDSLTSDIRGGQNAGVRTVWFNPQHKPPREDITPDYSFHALPELPALLEKIFAE